MMESMKYYLDLSSALHLANFASTSTQTMSPPPPASPRMDPSAQSCSPSWRGAEFFQQLSTQSIHADEVLMDGILPTQSIKSAHFNPKHPPRFGDRKLNNVMPSKNILPRKNVQRKSKPADRALHKFTNDMLNNLVPLQVRGKITTQDAISMGQAAKNILVSRTTVDRRCKNSDKVVWDLHDKGIKFRSSKADSGIEEKSIGCPSGFQSEQLHPLIREKLQLMSVLVNVAKRV